MTERLKTLLEVLEWFKPLAALTPPRGKRVDTTDHRLVQFAERVNEAIRDEERDERRSIYAEQRYQAKLADSARKRQELIATSEN